MSMMGTEIVRISDRVGTSYRARHFVLANLMITQVVFHIYDSSHAIGPRVSQTKRSSFISSYPPKSMPNAMRQ